MTKSIPAFRNTLPFNARQVAATALVAGALWIPAVTVAAPSLIPSEPAIARAQNVDYISPSSGAALDLGFPVLVPSWIPAPFGGEPSIDAGGGYYSLYWMNGGGDPTFLHIEGRVGGSLPVGSPYDLNVQLSINATVQGYGAIHDVTPAYDAVWWIAGGVLYKVESRNSGTDSLSLANSLIQFVPPDSAPAPEPTQPPAVEEPEAPVVDDPVVQEPVDEAPAADDPADDGAVAETTEDSTGQGGTTTTTEPEVESEGAAEAEPTPFPSDGTGDPTVKSDGTGGASIPPIGTDGTGGLYDVVVLRTRDSSGDPAP